MKLASGSEVKDRAHVHYYYDEGAPGGERYDLVTKTSDGAEYEGKEADVRTTTTSYSGQEDLGWLLRKPTSVTTEPSGLKLVRTTFYDPRTGNVTETRAPAAGGSGIPVGGYVYSTQVPTAGGLAMNKPEGVTVDSSGHVWVADTEGNYVAEFSSTGEYITRFAVTDPRGVGVDKEGHVWVVGGSSLQEYSSSGTLVQEVAMHEAGEPNGLAISSSGDIWVTEKVSEIEGRVDEYSSTGTYLSQLSEWASGGSNEFGRVPTGVAIDSKGNVWVTSNSSVKGYLVGGYSPTTGKRVGKLTLKELAKPKGIAISGESADVVGSNRVEELKFKTGESEIEGEYVSEVGKEGTGNGEFKAPIGVAVDSEGDIWVADTSNNRIQELNTKDEYTRQVTTAGGLAMNKPEGVTVDSSGHVWVADTEGNYVAEFSSTGEYITRFAVTDPRGVGVDKEGHVWVVGGSTLQEYSSSGTLVQEVAMHEAGEPNGLAISSSGDIWVTEKVSEIARPGGRVFIYGHLY